jgi:ribosome-associated protein
MEKLEFELQGEHVELCNLLKLVGLADSGGRGKQMVAEGLISVDGQPESRKTAKIRAGQVVSCGDVSVQVLAHDR